MKQSHWGLNQNSYITAKQNNPTAIYLIYLHMKRALLKLIYGDEVDGDQAAARLRKRTLFGDGNVERGFTRFSADHQCNQFCTWLDLKPFKDD